MARTGRPRTTTLMPVCPRGHRGTVCQGGTRKRNDGSYVRPLYWCQYEVAGKVIKHRFTASHEQRTHSHPAGAGCVECGTIPGRHQGLLVVPNFQFAAKLIADVFLAIGQGLTYGETGEKIRLADRRFVEIDDLGIAYASRQGTHIARYLDLFGDAVVASVAHTAWPKIVLLDAKPLRVRVYGSRGGVEAVESAGAFLAASGYTRPTSFYRDAKGDWHAHRARPHFWHVEFAGGEDTESWFEFLTHLGGEVEWVVCDDSDAIKSAARRRWPNAVVYSCEGHIYRLFEKAAIKDNLTPFEITTLWGEEENTALNSPETWRNFLSRVLDRPATETEEISGFIGRNYNLIESQWDLRRSGYPCGNGAMEASFGKLDKWIGERRKTFQNAHRLNVVLALMRAQIAGHADPEAYAKVIETEIERLCAGETDALGNPVINWRARYDRFGGRSVFTAVDVAHDRWLGGQTAYMATAKVSSLERKVTIANAYHASVGAPFLTLFKSVKSARVETTGKMLSDFPLVLREWDADANRGVDPAKEIAGRVQTRTWRCHRNPSHTWQATTRDRCAGLTGCKECDQAGRKGHKAGKPSAKSVAQIAGEIDATDLYDEDHDFTLDADYVSKEMSRADLLESLADDARRFPEDLYGLTIPPEDEDH